MLTGSPLSATYPTIPVPQGILISSFFSISSKVDLEHTSNNFDTRHLLLEQDWSLRCGLFPSSELLAAASWFREDDALVLATVVPAAAAAAAAAALLSPWTRNNEPRSAWRSVLTFCRILWHNDLTSSSLQMSLTCRDYAEVRLFKVETSSILHRRTYQFKNEILLVEMPELVSRPSLRPVRIAGSNLRPARLTRVTRWNAQEGRRAVDRVDDRLQKTSTLKLVRRDFAYGCRGTRAAGTASPGGRVTGRHVRRTRKLHATAGWRSRRRVWHQPHVHGLSRHFPAETSKVIIYINVCYLFFIAFRYPCKTKPEKHRDEK